jgi:hypothetical protein
MVLSHIVIGRSKFSRIASIGNTFKVGGENVKRNRTLCDLFFGGPLASEQYGKKKL